MTRNRVYTQYDKSSNVLWLCLKSDDSVCMINFESILNEYNFKNISQIAEYIIGMYDKQTINNFNINEITKILYDISQTYKDIINNKGKSYSKEDMYKYVKYLKQIKYRYGDDIPEFNLKKLMTDEEAADYFTYLNILDEMLEKRKNIKKLNLK